MSFPQTHRRTVLRLLGVVLSSLIGREFAGVGRSARGAEQQSVELPAPRRTSDVSVEETIANRRSRRQYDPGPLSLAELGQLLWAAQGVTDRQSGHRAAPSAGARYPLEVYAVVGRRGVLDLDPGVYRYQPDTHSLERVRGGDRQAAVREAALGQEWVGSGALDVVVTAVDERTTRRYGERGRLRYVPMEAGHAGENLALQAEALGLASVSIGAFRDRDLLDVLDAPREQRPLYVFPVGRKS